MLNTDKLYELAVDTTIHKKLVMDNCLMVSKYLMDKGDYELAISLLKRGACHDNSKFDSREFKSLASILKSKKCFTDATIKLTNEEKAAIEYHWKHNRHHPEYFSSPEMMTDLDIIEMVCDWFARSIQYKTEFIPFVLERQSNRFHFPDKMFNKVLGYCNLIESLYKEQNKD